MKAGPVRHHAGARSSTTHHHPRYLITTGVPLDAPVQIGQVSRR
jgi:hypothetical protein